MSDTSNEYFRELLRGALKSLKDGVGSYNALAIKLGIDRRKIAQLLEGPDEEFDQTTLKLGELHTLDTALKERGVGLSVLFSTPGITRALAEHGDVTFVIGSLPDHTKRRIDFSRWDMRAMREVLQKLNATGRLVHVGLEDVIYRNDSHEDFSTKAQVPENETWYQCLEEGGPSIVCLGSPKSCHASEVMLSRLFDRTPFEPWPECPFSFVWPREDERTKTMRSAFSRTIDDFSDPTVSPELTESLNNPGSRDCGFFDGEKVHAVLRDPKKEWDSYALVAFQKRPGNQIWLVVAGLTGPATFGAAQCLDQFRADFILNPQTRCSQTWWGIVKVHVKDQSVTDYRCDERRVVSYELVTRPLKVWPPKPQT